MSCCRITGGRHRAERARGGRHTRPFLMREPLRWLASRWGWADAYGFPSWRSWLRSAGVTGKQAEAGVSRGLRINNSAAVLQAAIEGQGAALARSVMAHDDLTAGRLVRLFPDIAFASEPAYYIVSSVQSFRRWWRFGTG